ncbi:MAG: phenylalanine--tRNA ligase subunit beta [Thiotrichales bacterium]|nr:MAG: phenylalanine--tRNA ligase subunit beta [Thiotrichales bacterium]
MKFTESWLREFTDPKISIEDIAAQLNLLGLEVSSVSKNLADFSKVVAGKIVSIAPHPDADKLQVCKVSISAASAASDLLQIVCGAKNIYVDMQVPVAIVGASLPNDFTIKPAKLRGVESYGMLCSAKELGLAEDASGILELDANIQLGTDLHAWFQKNQDTHIEIELTPNRGDCLSVLGIAREITVKNKTTLNLPTIEALSKEIVNPINIKISAKQACPAYRLRVIKNINQKTTTPKWIKDRLLSAGLRSKSFVVDVTNYVMLSIGQPLHAFDMDEISGDIEVRMAQSGETIRTLDDVEVALDIDTLVIADSSSVLAMAGIIGGMDSAVTEDTQNIVLESAFFTPKNINLKSRQYNLLTDSAMRFARGVDPKLNKFATEYATHLLLKYNDGKEALASNMVVQQQDVVSTKPITLQKAKVDKLLGVEISEKFIAETLVDLGNSIEKTATATWQVTPPSWRFDLAIVEDLIEEIARIYGYDNIPDVMPEFSYQSYKISNTANEIDMKNSLVNRGYQEAINYSFINEKLLNKIFRKGDFLKLRNPISKDMSIMRPSLIPGLLKNLDYNVKRQQERIRLFEIGKCFENIQNTKIEIPKLAAVAYGIVNPISWQDNKHTDFFDIKADVIAVLKSMNASSVRFSPIQDADPLLHPGKSAKILQGDKTIGLIGEVHPVVLKVFKIKQLIYVFELDIREISIENTSHFTKITKFPSIRRDFSVVLNKTITADRVIEVVKASSGDILQDIHIFDVYEKGFQESQQKSLSFNVVMQDKTATLTEEKVSTEINKIIGALQKELGAELRST